MNRPAVLLVDEPTSALDQSAGASVVDLIVSLSRVERTATLLVTHDVAHLPRVDQRVEMLDGRLGEVQDARYSVHG
jgi:putative ABC transport system ATP-binding protein